MIFGAGQTVTLISKSTVRDPYGDSTDTVVRTDVPGCGVAPRTSSEQQEPGRAQVIVGLTVYMPSGTVVASNDQLEVRGLLYEVDGEVGVWESPFTGWSPGVEVAVKRATG